VWDTVADTGSSLLGAIRFPGADTGYGVISVSRYRGDYCTVCTGDGFEIGRYPEQGKPGGFAAGTRLVPPPSYWHYLRPRDEAGSAALRSCPDELAGALLARVHSARVHSARVHSARVHSDSALGDEALHGTAPDDATAGNAENAATALVRELLPQVSDASLAAGIAGVVQQAAISAGRLAEFGAVLAGQLPEQASPAVHPAEAAAAVAGKPGDAVLAGAFHGLVPWCGDRGYSAVRLIETAGAVLTGPEPDLAAALSLPYADLDWLRALFVLRAAMYRAVCPATPARYQEALLGFLEVCAGSGLLAPGGRLRLLLMLRDEGEPSAKPGDVIQVGPRRLLVLSWDKHDNEIRALDYAPDGTFGAVPGFHKVRQLLYDTQGVTPEMIASFLSLAREKGPLPWRPELPAALSGAAGISLAEATAVLAGLPDEEAWKESAGADWRGSVAVADDAAASARRTWDAQGRLACASATGMLLPGDPAADLSTLWETGPRADQLTVWLTELRGARTPVADDLIVGAQDARIASGLSASELLHGLASPGTCRWLTGRVAGLDDADVLKSVVRAVPWLAGRLPGDHPLRAALPAALELARGRLADPDTALNIGYITEKEVNDLPAVLGLPATQDQSGGITVGPVFIPTVRSYAQAMLHPARLAGPDDPLLGVLSVRLANFRDEPAALMRALCGEHMAAWATYQVPEAAIGAEHDPSRAAPDLVREVAARHGLSADAATLYLQILALPEPTDRKVAEWAGWKPARLKAARAELAGTDLVVAGKRARAGRSLFLPGGWITRGAPLPPMETWKQPLIIDGVKDAVIAVAPAPPLFEIAWQRVRDGDGPRFDDLVLEKRR
jgi:hypothetical protein